MNDANRDGETALLGAVYRGGAVPVIQFLADKGAKLDVANKKQWTPLLAAEGVVYASSGIRRYPEAAALIRRLMRERGLPIPEIVRDGGAVPIVKAADSSASGGKTIWDGVFTEQQVAARPAGVSARVCRLPPRFAAGRRRVADARRERDSWRDSPDRARTRWCRTCAPRCRRTRRTASATAPTSISSSYLLKANGSKAGALELPLDVAELEKIARSSDQTGLHQ